MSIPARASAARPLLASALLVALLSGCFGLPEGAAGTGDLVTIRYTAEDLDTAATLRSNETASFDVGSGASGLGMQVERAVRGRKAGDEFTVTVRDDPSLGYHERVEVPRGLQDIEAVQSAPLGEFQQFVGPAAVNVTFPAYGIYTGRVLAVTNSTVTFRVEAEDGQLDDVAVVGSVLETRVGDGILQRRLNPLEGATFTIQAPGQFQSTPLGLEPGSYRVEGATDDDLVLLRSTAEEDLLDRDLRITITVVAVTPADRPVPTDGNFGVRPSSPVVSGDPNAALGKPEPAEGEPAGDTH